MKYKQLHKTAPSTKKIVSGINGISRLFSDVLYVSENKILEQIKESKNIELIINDIEDLLIKEELISNFIENSNPYYLKDPTSREELLNSPIALVNRDSCLENEFYIPHIRIPFSIYAIGFDFDGIDTWINEELQSDLDKNPLIIDIVVELLKETIIENNKQIISSKRSYIKSSLNVLNEYYKEAYQMIFREFETKKTFTEEVLLSLDEFIIQVLHTTASELNFKKLKTYLNNIEILSYLNTQFPEHSDIIICYLGRHYTKNEKKPSLTLESYTKYFSFCVLIGLDKELMKNCNNKNNKAGDILFKLFYFFELDLQKSKNAKDNFRRFLNNKKVTDNIYPLNQLKNILNILTEQVGIPIDKLFEPTLLHNGKYKLPEY